MGLHEIDSGRVRYDDTDFTHLGFRERKAIRRDIGMIFQGGALLDSSTVEENVRLPLDLFTDQSAAENANASISACAACASPTPTGSIRPSSRAA